MFKPEPIGGLSAEEVQEMFVFLDDLRESGKINMFGAYPHVSDAFAIDDALARRVWAAWAASFDQRHGSRRPT